MLPLVTSRPELHDPPEHRLQTGGQGGLIYLVLRVLYFPPLNDAPIFKIQLLDDSKKKKKKKERKRSDLYLLQKTKTKIKIRRSSNPSPPLHTRHTAGGPSRDSMCSVLHHCPHHSLMPHSTRPSPSSLSRAHPVPVSLRVGQPCSSPKGTGTRGEPEPRDVKWPSLTQRPS